MKVYVPRCAKTVRKTFFNVRVCNSWNSLPQHVTEAQSTNSKTRQILVRYGRMKASAAELINIKYQVQVDMYRLTVE